MSSDHVLSGRVYVDHDRAFGAKWQWLVSDYTANIVSNALAVFLTLSSRGLFIIVKRCIKILVLPSEVHYAANESHSPEGLFYRLCKSLFQGVTPGFIRLGDTTRRCGSVIPSRQFLGDIWIAFKDRMVAIPGTALIVSGMAVLYISTILISIFSALVVSDSTAVSNHPACSFPVVGNLTPDLGNLSKDVTETVFFQGLSYYFNRETETGEYYRNCYNKVDTELCNYFYQQSIQVSTEESIGCRFQSEFGDLCDTNFPTGLSMSTAWIQPETIGINTQFKYAFRRQATCSPLRTDPPFVQEIHKNSTLFYRYRYGQRPGNYKCTSEDSNCTYELPVTWDIGSKAGYTVHSDTSLLFDWPNVWQWRPSFAVNTTAGEIASLILISNVGIIYPKMSKDPLFRADARDGEWYFNPRLHAGVLGCIERTEICTPNGSFCAGLGYWSNLNSVDGSEESRTIAYLLMSLYGQYIGTAINYRGENALDANSKKAAHRSLALDPEQWKIEAKQLFLTSLAGVQILARNIARGYPGEVPDMFVDLMDEIPQLRGLCNMYKFKSTWWKNISVSGLLGAVFAGVLVLLLSRTTENEEELRVEEYYRNLRRLAIPDTLKTSGAAAIKQLKRWSEATKHLLNRRVQLSDVVSGLIAFYRQSFVSIRLPHRQHGDNHELD